MKRTISGTFAGNGSIAVILFITFTMSGLTRSYSQGKPDPIWFDAGLGYVLGETNFGGPGLGGGLCVSQDKHLFSVRFTYFEEFNIFGPTPNETLWDLAFMYGRFVKGSNGIASISGGLSLVGGLERGKLLYNTGTWFGHNVYESVHFATIGIPIEGQLIWTPFAHFGIGVNGFCDLNPRKSFAGALLCLKFGTFR